MNKRLLALFLSLVLLSSFSVPVFAEEEAVDATAVEVQEVEACEEFNIAQSLSLIGSKAKAGDIVTRGDAAVAITRLLNLQEVSIESLDFEDVKSGSSYYNAVGVVSSNGIMLGDGNGNFRPDDKISRTELAVVLVRSVGYDVVAVQKGGYPNGYFSVASELKFFRGVSTTNESEINLNEFSKIMYNVFDVKIMSLDSIPSDGKYEITDSTVLNLMNIVKIKGVVTKNNKTALYSNSSYKDGVVLVNGTEIICGDTNLSEMLGYGVCIFVKDTTDDDDRVAYYAAEYNTEITQIEFCDLDTNYDIFQNSGVKYYNDNGRTVTERLKTGCAVIYNDVASSFRTMSLITGNEGLLKLIDNNSDGQTDVVFIDVYTDYVIDTANEEMELISDKFGKMLDLENVDDTLEIVNKNGQEVGWSGLSEWNVVSVYDSYVQGKENTGTRHVKMVVSTDVVTGKVSGISEDGNTKTVTINDKEYEVSSCYITSDKVKQIDSSSDGTFYLNSNGKICAYAVDGFAALEIKYGILVEASPGEGLMDEVKYKIFTSNDEFITPLGAEKIKIDGKIHKKSARYDYFVDGGTVTRQAIGYKLNENGEVYYIDTGIQNPEEGPDSLKKIYSMEDPELTYRWGSVMYTFQHYFQYTNNTAKFNIPSDPADEDAYKNKISLKESKKYHFDVYVTDNPFEAAVIVFKDSYKTSFEYSYMALIKSVTTISEDEDIMTKLVLSGYDGEKTLYVSTDAESAKGLIKGDVIAYTLKDEDIIDEVYLIYDYAEKNVLLPDNGFASNERVSSGYVFKKYADWFNISKTPETESVDNVLLESRRFSWYKDAYVYHMKNDTVTKATANDILDYETYGNKCAFLLVSEYATYAKCLFLYVE